MDWLLYENEAIADGYNVICGIDEAGRGPLAGPVTTAAVVLPHNYVIEGADDSKKLSEKKREYLYDKIIDECLYWGVASASEKEIDQINILNATFLAMRRAVDKLGIQPDCALIDGNREPGLSMEQRTIVKGDGKSASIAAASIIAKVTRDRYMLELARQYPQYQFEKHKGYPTKLHYQMIEQYGVSPVHRLSFLKKVL